MSPVGYVLPLQPQVIVQVSTSHLRQTSTRNLQETVYLNRCKHQRRIASPPQSSVGKSESNMLPNIQTLSSNPVTASAKIATSSRNVERAGSPARIAYQPPETGILSVLPAWTIPYAELMRLHKPAGYFAFLFPHLFGTFLAASVLCPEPPSIYDVLKVCWLHAVSCVVLRGAACAYNDALDAEYDRLVERCRNRPVARGAVSVQAAHRFALAQTAIWIALLRMMPREVLKPAALLAAIMVTYPFCKRWTNFPQVILGFSLALGQGVGIGGMGLDVWGTSDPKITLGLAGLYLANVVNTMIYDTVYAYQDIDDDLKAGVMSMAIACLGWTKQWLGLLSMIEATLLFIAGRLVGYTGPYWLFTFTGTAVVLAYMLFDWDPKQPASCWKWFCWTIWLTGGTICLGMAIEYLYRLG